MESVSDEDLRKIGNAIGNDIRLTKLALNLGLSLNDVKSCLKNNLEMGDGCGGTQLLLSKWKKITDAKEPASKLRKALVSSGLKEISDIFLPKTRKRKTGSNAKTGQTDEERSKKPKKQGILHVRFEPPPATPTETPVIKEEQRALPAVKDETQETAPAGIEEKPQTKAGSSTAKKTSQRESDNNDSKKKKKRKSRGKSSLEAKKNELEKEEKALKKYEREADKSRKAIAKLKESIVKMEEAEKVQLEKTLAETKAKLNKLNKT